MDDFKVRKETRGERSKRNQYDVLGGPMRSVLEAGDAHKFERFARKTAHKMICADKGNWRNSAQDAETASPHALRHIKGGIPPRPYQFRMGGRKGERRQGENDGRAQRWG